MKVTGVLLLTLSAVTPASSVFVIVPGVIQMAGTGAFIAMAVAACIALAMALVYAELSSAYPVAGGEYSLMGHTLGPFVGFVFMVSNVVGSTMGPAVLSLGAGAYVNAIWPGVPTVPLALGIIGASMLLGVLNIRLNAWVTGAFLAVELLALIILGALGFMHARRPISEFLLHPMVVTHGHFAPASVASIGLATAVAVFAYNGFGAAVCFSEEMHEAPRRVSRAILLALGLTIAFEFIPMAAVLIGAPDLKAMIASERPFSDFVLVAGGRTLDTVVSLGVALAIVNAVIAIVLINARFYFSSARDRVWHGGVNALLTRLHSRFDSPWVATMLAGATGMATCFVPLHVLLVFTGAGVVVMYALLCLAVLAGRITGSTSHGVYRMPLFPLAPAVALAALIYVLYANWIDPDVGRPSLIVDLAIMTVAAPYYVMQRRRRGAAWFMSAPRRRTMSPPLTGASEIPQEAAG